MNILITGARSFAAIDWARSLGIKHNVFVADSTRFNASASSKYVVNAFRYHSPKFDIDNFTQDIQEIISSNKIDMIIPTCEEAFYLAMIKDSLPRECFCFVSDFDLLKQIHSKYELKNAFFPELNYPQTTKFTTGKIHWKPGKEIVKPEWTRFNENHTERTIDLFGTKETPLLVQEKINGREICAYIIAIDGRVMASSYYEPASRYESGASVFFKSVEAPELHRRISEFISRTGYTGQLGLDVMEFNNDYYVIDGNPRGTSGIHLLDKSELSCIFDENAQEITHLKSDYCHKLPMLLFSDQVTTGKGCTWKDGKDALFDKRDLLPSFYQVLSLIEFSFVAIKHKISIKKAMTNDMLYDHIE